MFPCLQQDFRVRFQYRVLFTSGVFTAGNPLFAQVLASSADDPAPARLLFVVDRGVSEAHPDLVREIGEYCRASQGALEMPIEPIVVPGGEVVKNIDTHVRTVHEAIEHAGICRHSYVIAVGGGSVLDMAGYAASTAHRGVRLVRVPTTVLAQNDSGVGVKTSVNAFGKKNFLGTFAPPWAVINDDRFLTTLSERDWRSGIAEAIKVALIKDPAFFDFLERNAAALSARGVDAMRRLIHRCAQLHVEHIAGGDPFESGSSRPLDFGHWAAHKLEHLTDYRLRHGEAVAIGMALDATYSYLAGRLPEPEWRRILDLSQELGFDLWVPELEEHLDEPEHPGSVLRGLTEFREHLGGQLTIMLLEGIGRTVEVHEMDARLIADSVALLAEVTQERFNSAATRTLSEV